MTLKVTIGMPTYNRASGFLVPALECALAQDWENLEIIVSDNCSDDNTGDIVNSYDDPRIRYFRQKENIGANNNFNFCAEQAQGTYFLMFHDDDVIDSDIVSSCMEAAGGNPGYGIIRTGTRLIDGDGNFIRDIPNRAAGLDYNAFFRGWMKGRFTSYVCSTMFNTQMLKDIGGFRSQHGLYQDLIAIARLMARGGRADVEASKASFRRHDENYGNAADLRARCEDAVELAEAIASEAPAERGAIYQESMQYMCWTVYRHARRSSMSKRERLQAYRMIDAEFQHAYPVARYLYDRIVKTRYKAAKTAVRRALQQ